MPTARSPWFRRLAWACLALASMGIGVHRALTPGLPFLLKAQQREVEDRPFSIEERAAFVGSRRVPLRVYRPLKPADRSLLLLHGVHTLGFDEPRLTRFARQLAREGYLVVTPDLVDLKDYDLAPTAVDDIEAAALDLLEGLGGATLPHRPTMMGISFAGGLGLCAAGRPSLQHRLGGILVFGGYGNLDRVLTYLASGDLPEGGHLAPHLYGQAVVARRMAEALVPAPEVEPLRAALKLFLQERQGEFAAAVEGLPSASKAIARLCLKWDSAGMCALLRPIAAQVRADGRVSPEKNPRPDCPLYFLHGAEDNVIPPSESLALGRWAASGGPSTALVTKLIRHVELEEKQPTRPPLGEAWKLIRLWTEFLRS